MADLEAQRELAGADVASPRSPLARLSLHRRSDSGRRQQMRVKTKGLNASSSSDSMHAPRNGQPSSDAVVSSPLSPASATIFRTLDRPDLQMMESYEVAGGDRIFGSPGRTRTEPFRDTPRSPGLFKSSTLRPQRSRSQNKSITVDDRVANTKRRSSSKPRYISQSEDDAIAAGESAAAAPAVAPAASAGDADTAKAAAANLASESEDEDAVIELQPTTATTMGSGFPMPLRQRLSELHAKHPHLKSLPSPLLPIVAFPGQGSGRMSEFDQAAPIWAQQPYKLMYFAYFGLSVGLVFLPWFAIVSILPSMRERPSWTWKKSTLVKLYRHGTRLTFRTHTSLSRDLTKEVPHSKTVRAKFVWVNGLPEDLVRGELKRGLEVQGLNTVRTCGFWYGKRDGGGGVGQKAVSGEKVVYHLHGGAYWIGTAHEKDVTAAVNVQLLRALNSIYSKRLPSADEGARLEDGIPASPHPPMGGPGAGRGGVCKRAFSLDYRLCVPGRPEVGSFPAPLADALAGYRYLVQECAFDPNNIIVAGDSAGGNLALAMCRYLRDEKIEAMPGAMLLLSPWADTSRSHSGPTSAPNKLSTVYSNRNSDIIAPSLAFRNTAVSALLGKMPARETYKNPYLSSISLQLSAKDGGSGPSWGFDGFPRRIYVCTGTAEISHDQHVTLAYRLAGGSRLRVPVFSGDKCHESADPYEMAARLQYPRPDDHEVTLWPSAQTTPAHLPIPPPSDGWTELQHMSSGPRDAESVQTAAQSEHAKTKPSSTQANGHSGQVEAMNNRHSDDAYTRAEREDGEKTSKTDAGLVATTRDATRNTLESVSRRLKSADGYLPTMSQLRSRGARLTALTTKDRNAQESMSDDGDDEAAHHDYEAGDGPNTSQVKEKDTAQSHATHKEARQREQNTAASPPTTATQANGHQDAAAEKVEASVLASSNNATSAGRLAKSSRATPAVKSSHVNSAGQSSYFELGADERKVVLDECVDGIHDYTLFDWFEPERGQTWARIAQWVDEEV